MVVAHTTVVIMVVTSLWMILTMPLKSFSTASGKTTSETVSYFILLSLIFFKVPVFASEQTDLSMKVNG